MKALRVLQNPRVVFLREKRVAAPAPLVSEEKILHFDASVDISSPEAKSFDVVKEGDKVVDYHNVRIKGYLSTFVGTTPADRDGDYVKPGAFADAIPKFMRNPVMLVNHRNDVISLVGSFTKMKEDDRGLYFEGVLSNSPDEVTRSVRFKVAEGILRTASMGGLFHYEADGRGIFRVDLFEGSLTPIPANPDAIYSVRSLTDAEAKKARYS